MILINNIKNKLKEKHMTASYLESAAGLKKGTIANILLGRSKNPKLETIRAIAEFFSSSVDEITGTDLANKPDPMDWNYKLFFSALKSAESSMQSRDISPSFEEMISLLRKVYAYSYSKGNQKVDIHFLNWLLDNHFKKP